jgi:hypothetical protein
MPGFVGKRKQTEMNKFKTHNGSHLSDRPEKDVTFLLTKIQRQLTFLEKKIDSLIDGLQESPRRERFSGDNRLRKKPFPGASNPSRQPRRREKPRQEDRHEEEGAAQPFYARYSKSGRAPAGPRKKYDRPGQKPKK